MEVEQNPNGSSEVSSRSGRLSGLFSFLALQGTGDRSAFGYLLIGVFFYSWLPLSIALSGGGESPFLFGAGMRFGAFVCVLVIVLVAFRGLVWNRAIWDLMWMSLRKYRWFSGLLFVVTVAKLDYALLAWSTHYLDVSVSTVAFELYHIAWIFVLSRIYGDRKQISKWSYALLFIAFSGVGFVVFSQSDGTGDSAFNLLNIAKGLILVAGAIFIGAFWVIAFRFGDLLAVEWKEWQKKNGENTQPVSSVQCFRDPESLQDPYGEEKSEGENTSTVALFGALLASIVGSLIAAVFSLALGGFQESFSFEFNLLLILVPVLMGVGHGIADSLYRLGNLINHNLGINAVTYLAPILALGWLFAFSLVEVSRVDYLVIGASAVIIANLLISFDAEIRWGFKVLLLALGAAGAIVYFREEGFRFLGIDGWYWSAGGYFESIALAATVFILLLAFRVARLVNRTTEEDNRTFIVYRKFDTLVRRGVISSEISDCIVQIDQANGDPSSEEEAYARARQLIADVDPAPLGEADIQLLSDAEANLDGLARSKQVDIHLGEMFALYVFGLVTVGLALFSRPPDVEGWTRLQVDLFAIVISAVVIFLLAHIHDLQKERDESKLQTPAKLPTEHRHRVVRFLNTERRSFDQALSIFVGLAIVLIYAGLLANKWIGLFSG